MSTKRKDLIFYISMLILTVGIFGILGAGQYFEFTDSKQYIYYYGSQGVTPIYPLFIHLHRVLLGEDKYLYGTAVTQTIIAIGCLWGFIIWLRKRFETGYGITFLSLIVSLVPFLVEFPPIMINRSFLTEGLTYALFYSYAIVFIETLIRKQYRWLLFLTLVSVVLAAIRTQMQLCFVFIVVAAVYAVWIKYKENKWEKRLFHLSTAVIVGLLLAIAGEVAMLKITKVLKPIALRQITYANEEMEGGEVKATAAESSITHLDNSNITRQFNSILIDRTFYEIDLTDAELFEDIEMQALVGKIYEVAEEEKTRYTHAASGLWKWRDIMNGTAAGTKVFSQAWQEYVEENPNSSLINRLGEVSTEISVTLLKEHWPRMIYHTLCMLPQGFICTVFFQVESIYALCHLYTLLVYLFAIALTVWGFWKKGSSKKSELILGALLLNILVVGITCVVFFGQQRYLIYGFGVFYTSLLVMVEQIWKNYGKTWLKKVDFINIRILSDK